MGDAIRVKPWPLIRSRRLLGTYDQQRKVIRGGSCHDTELQGALVRGDNNSRLLRKWHGAALSSTTVGSFDKHTTDPDKHTNDNRYLPLTCSIFAY